MHGGKIYIGMSNCMQLYTDFSSSESFWGESVDVKLACGFSANHGTQTIMAASYMKAMLSSCAPAHTLVRVRP